MPLNQKMLATRLKEAREGAQITQVDAAKAIRIDRTILAKIESGNRSVSGLELDRLARLYRRNLTELLSEEPLDDDPLLLLGRTISPEFLSSERVTHVIELIRRAAEVERLIGEPLWTPPPGYDFHEPRTQREANEQGREMAWIERERLGLGNGPVTDMAELIASQGIWAAAFDLPQEVSGLFLCHPDFGLTILVNCDNAKGRRRFSYAHEYAHALADRNRSPVPSMADNAKDLIERRANVFASEFLVPIAGVHEYLERFRKGHKSRVSLSFWDAALNEGESVEDRVTPGSQRITCLEAWYLASEFKVSYEMAVYRLRHAGAIKEPEVEELKAQKHFGAFLTREFELNDVENQNGYNEDETQPHLKMQIARLLIEGYRRGAIFTSKFREICEMAEIQFDELYPLAKAAQQSLPGE